MKHLFYIIILLSTLSCGSEMVTPEPIPCSIGYFEHGTQNNVLFTKTTESDTIYVLWDHPQYGSIPLFWNEGVTDWSCIGFTLDYPLSITIWTEKDTCYFFIPTNQ